jgi:hypothetical protein
VSRPHRTRRFQIEASLPSRASGAEVVDYVRRPETWPRWQAEIQATRGSGVLSAGDVVDGDARLLGFDVTGRSAVVKVSDDTFTEDVIVGVRIRVSYSVSPTPSGSVVTHRMEADLPAGAVGSVLSMVLGWRLKKMQKNLLAALAEQARGA